MAALNVSKLQETLRNTVDKAAQELLKKATDDDTAEQLTTRLRTQFGRKLSNVTENEMVISRSDDTVWIEASFEDPDDRLADLWDISYHAPSKKYCEMLSLIGMDDDTFEKKVLAFSANAKMAVNTANKEIEECLDRQQAMFSRQLTLRAEERRLTAARAAEEKARLEKRPNVDAVLARHGLTTKKPGQNNNG